MPSAETCHTNINLYVHIRSKEEKNIIDLWPLTTPHPLNDFW